MLDRRIQTFIMLYDTMSYHETAARLNMTQPAVTQQIQALEGEYGCKLFHYDRRALHKTAAADTLAQYARSVQRSDALVRAALIQPSEKPPLRIGATKSIGDFVLGAAVARYLENPAHRLEVIVDNTTSLLASLEKNEIDFALVEGNFDR